MAFPPKDPNAPPRPKVVWGPNKSRRYAVWYVSRKKGGKDDLLWSVSEFRATSVGGVHNAVVRRLRAELNRPELRKSDVLIMEAHVLPPRVTLEQHLANLYPDVDE